MLVDSVQRRPVGGVELLEPLLRFEGLTLRDLEVLLIEGADHGRVRHARLRHALVAHGQDRVHQLGRRAGIVRREGHHQQVRPEDLHAEPFTDLLQVLRFIGRRGQLAAERGALDHVAQEALGEKKLVEQLGLLHRDRLHGRDRRIARVSLDEFRRCAQHPDGRPRLVGRGVLDEGCRDARSPDERQDRGEQPSIPTCRAQVWPHRVNLGPTH